MKRPWQVWLTFVLSAAVAAGAMAWLTAHALRIDRERSAARAAADLEQLVSLALWRMDTKLAPLIAEEVARPHQFYDSFIAINGSANAPAIPAETVPSPLLNQPGPNVILNFETSANGQWKSPQAPPPEQAPLALKNSVSTAKIGANRDRLAELARQVNVRSLIEQLPAEPLPEYTQGVAVHLPATEDELFGDAPTESEPNAAAQQQEVGNYVQSAGPAATANAAGSASQRLDAIGANAPNAPAQAAVGKSSGDFFERNGRFQQAAQQEFSKQRSNSAYWNLKAAAAPMPVIENVSRPLWVGDQLLLARRVERAGETFVQGSWLDWPRLKRDLLSETADLLPKADLVPVRPDDAPDPTRTLAGLPVKVVVGDTAAALVQRTTADGPLQWALAFGWAALVLALGAVGGLLWGVVALSERRAAFVSSVTHELRTPLTTFRLYAEMLARDMAPTAERRQEYLETLKTEAERLTHLVENVLSYARLERGRRPQRCERTTAAALVSRLEPRLAERVERAAMRLECSIEETCRELPLTTDLGVVEQVLFNLVDNAAKYAARAADRRVCLEVTREKRFVRFRVRDFGPGFSSPRAAAHSVPFNKSAQEAAETAPGVGLGLALCRRLARELGGDLQIDVAKDAAGGAAVTLRLPVEA